eukprot:gene8326-17143_t
MEFLGRVYKIVAKDGLVAECYIGSTTKSLAERMQQHKLDYRKWKNGKYHYVTVFQLFEKYAPENCSIIELASQQFTTKKDLFAKEREYIEAHYCINQYIPNRTGAEYYKDNREDILSMLKEQINCPCGGKFTKMKKARHERSDKHIKSLATVVEAK